MWAFASDLLEKAGVVAAFAFLGFVVCGIFFRLLWKQNQDLNGMIQTTLKAEHEKRSKMREAHDKELQLLDRTYTKRLDELQEKRVQRAEDTTEKVITTVGRIDRALDKQATALGVLIELGGRRT